MVIVDTSAFIPLLRGKASPALETLVVAGLVQVSSTVFLELLQGVRKNELKPLKRFLKSLGNPLPWPDMDKCLRVLSASYGSGLRVGLPDIMVVADCLTHKSKLMTLDNQLQKLAAKLGVPIVAEEVEL